MHALHKFLLFHVLTCLRPNALGSEIVNGHIAQPNSLQFMASLQDSDGESLCGGSLISDNFILTAAHCADPDSTPLRRVVLGTHDLRNPRVVRRIAQTCKHPDYQRLTLQSDIMLLKLSKAVPVGRGIKHIKLPTPDMKIEDNQMCHVAGWGVTETDWFVDNLRVVRVSVVNQDVCEQRWKTIHESLPANVICAGGYETLRGFCSGDSGGPLVCNNTAVGVVSFSSDNGDYCNEEYPNVPNVYTDVSKFRPWIDKVLSQDGC